jgi:hypothetical protein
MGGGGGIGGSGGMGGGGGMGGVPETQRTATPGPGSVAQGSPDASHGKDATATAAPEYAATGMGNRVDHEVERIPLNLEDKPFATVNLRYEFRPILVKLGVPLSRPIEKEPLARREKAKGFSNAEYCPER